MPYIAKEERKPYQEAINNIVKDIVDLDYKEKGSALRNIILTLVKRVYFRTGMYINHLEELYPIIPEDHMKKCGHMNYIISRIISKSYGDKALRYYEWNQIIGTLELVKTSIDYLRTTKDEYASVSYEFTKNYVWIEIFGFLEGAKMEIYRRYVAPYEDSKINDASCGDLLEV